jgi:hypothetical protein
MSSKLHQALERLDTEIDGLEAALDAFLVHVPPSEPVAEPDNDRAEVLEKLDGIIGKLETILKA